MKLTVSNLLLPACLAAVVYAAMAFWTPTRALASPSCCFDATDCPDEAWQCCILDDETCSDDMGAGFCELADEDCI